GRWHTRLVSDWSAGVGSSDLRRVLALEQLMDPLSKELPPGRMKLSRGGSSFESVSMSCSSARTCLSSIRGASNRFLSSSRMQRRSEERRVGKGGRTEGGLAGE